MTKEYITVEQAEAIAKAFGGQNALGGNMWFFTDYAFHQALNLAVAEVIGEPVVFIYTSGHSVLKDGVELYALNKDKS